MPIKDSNTQNCQFIPHPRFEPLSLLLAVFVCAAVYTHNGSLCQPAKSNIGRSFSALINHWSKEEKGWPKEVKGLTIEGKGWPIEVRGWPSDVRKRPIEVKGLPIQVRG